MNLTPAKEFRRAQIKEPKVAIGPTGNHVGLELVHRYSDAFFFWNDELLGVLDVVHVPELDLTITASCGNLIVLVECVELVLFVRDVELAWRYVLEVAAAYFHIWVMAVLEAESYVLDPRQVPD